jgi:large subunit ribosomal protein L16
MLQPRKTKYRKQFRGKMKGIASRGTTLAFGDYGLKSLGRGWLTAKQIEAARVAITHYTKREGKIWLRVFPDKPITSKGLGVGMGAGKGDVVGWVAVVTPGRILFELGGVTPEIAQEALRRAAAKLPFKTKIVSRSD